MYKCITLTNRVTISVDGRCNGPSDSMSHELSFFTCNSSEK